jgi:predicted nucleotidyltransferase
MSAVLPIPRRQTDELRRVADRHGVERVRVFGSVARGESTPRSDVDLLIRLKPRHGFSDFMAFCEEAERVLGRRVDVVTEDGLSPYLRDRVLAEAVSL